ncbi:unannotated protein [freshwater metagenome]|uniref:Unannotated protein n=1 Tax=freshwater metagenome TaxID=449393 RepID=A0A6J7UN33_9ZZZZ
MGQLGDCHRQDPGDTDRFRRQENRRSVRIRDRVAIAHGLIPFGFHLAAKDAIYQEDKLRSHCVREFQKSFRRSLALSSCSQGNQKRCRRRDPCQRCAGCDRLKVRRESANITQSCDSCCIANHCLRVCQMSASPRQSHNIRTARSPHHRATR